MYMTGRWLSNIQHKHMHCHPSVCLYFVCLLEVSAGLTTGDLLTVFHSFHQDCSNTTCTCPFMLRIFHCRHSYKCCITTTGRANAWGGSFLANFLCSIISVLFLNDKNNDLILIEYYHHISQVSLQLSHNEMLTMNVIQRSKEVL